MLFQAGIIEGFYGRSWSWEARAMYADFLKDNGFGFYIYAPKDDAWLRKRWNEPWPDDRMDSLTTLGSAYRALSISWGIGLSPYEIYLSFDDSAKGALEQKVESINQLDPDILCVLLDDMKGDVPGLADKQIEIFNTITDLSTARRFILCPTYYSYDPILEKVFGAMPDGYWDALGKGIDPSVDIFWTGPKVCSTEYPEDHVTEVADRLGRKPFLWDNYPVNDSETRSKRLYLSAYENRPHGLCELTAGHAVNPMNQPWLSRIPIWTLAESYRTKDDYDPERALVNSVNAQCDPDLAETILSDAQTFQDSGLDGMKGGERQVLLERYGRFRSPFAYEILDWLNDTYTFDPACLTE